MGAKGVAVGGLVTQIDQGKGPACFPHGRSVVREGRLGSGLEWSDAVGNWMEREGFGTRPVSPSDRGLGRM